MRKIRKFMYSLHRITGVFVCLFFLMWFVSGLVLIYFPFPNVSKTEKYENMDILPDSLPTLDIVLSRLTETDKRIKEISVKFFQGQTLFTIKTNDSLFVLCGDTAQTVKCITSKTIEDIARKWVNAPFLKIDTLTEREMWIMYSHYTREMPIHKFYFDTKDKHELYIAARSGEVQQFTNREQRFWAWMGAIPHKLYIPALRKNADRWILVLTVGGVIALVAALSGMYIGISAIRKRYRRTGRIGSPYRKWWHKWHHVTGMVFGIFLITFAFSGAIAMQRIPQWIIKTHGNYSIGDSQLRGKGLGMNSYVLDYRLLKKEYQNIKSIKWSNFQNIPVYNIVVGNKEICIDASCEMIKELFLTQSQIEDAIKNIYGEDYPLKISLIDNYEEYYFSRKKRLPLPTYKVEVGNEDSSCYYIDPQSGNFNYVNQSRKVKKWVFSGLHYLNIKWLVDRPILWTIAIWILCLGGMFVSGSGVWLSIKCIGRKLKQRK